VTIVYCLTEITCQVYSVTLIHGNVLSKYGDGEQNETLRNRWNPPDSLYFWIQLISWVGLNLVMGDKHTEHAVWLYCVMRLSIAFYIFVAFPLFLKKLTAKTWSLSDLITLKPAIRTLLSDRCFSNSNTAYQTACHSERKILNRIV